jgi:uncharacterized membrane protein
MKILISYFAIIFCLITSCNSKSSEKINQDSSSYTTSEESIEKETESDDEDAEENNTRCKFEDGNYTATVDYNNSETGYSATYTLDVEVQDCQVVQINFPNDGYLDEDHISFADIDEDGSASVDGEDGKTYEIQIYY